MKQVTIRLELRVSEEMNEFLQMEAQSRKLSFEGLLLMYVEDRMKKDRQDSCIRHPAGSDTSGHWRRPPINAKRCTPSLLFRVRSRVRWRGCGTYTVRTGGCMNAW